ncbi:MAG: chitobiase/beta-hexosaminidase C-terminal domain-containing protein, partial [Gaiellaceae bacterium]
LVRGPASGMVVDSSGNRLGVPDPAAGVELSEIPGAVFNAAGDNASYFVTQSDDYRGAWTATADGQVQVVVRNYADDAVDATASTPPITVRAGAVLSLSYSTPAALGAAAVTVDDDGDGAVDRTVAFGGAVEGAAAADVTAPVSKVSVREFKPADGSWQAEVTIAATDEPGGSGVDRIEYALDASDRSGTYTGPLTVPADGNIIVRAIDRAGNVEAPYRVVALDDVANLRDQVTRFLEPHFNEAGYLEHPGDVDWWGLDVPQACRYQLQLIGLQDDYDLALYDADGKLLATSANRGQESEQIVADLPAGHAYLVVSGRDGAADAKSDYRLNVTGLG